MIATIFRHFGLTMPISHHRFFEDLTHKYEQHERDHLKAYHMSKSVHGCRLASSDEETNIQYDLAGSPSKQHVSKEHISLTINTLFQQF